jgi:hypothetical protein
MQLYQRLVLAVLALLVSDAGLGVSPAQCHDARMHPPP